MAWLSPVAAPSQFLHSRMKRTVQDDAGENKSKGKKRQRNDAAKGKQKELEWPPYFDEVRETDLVCK